MTDNFEQLVDQALAEFAASHEAQAPKEQTEYRDYAELLREISDEDEDLAKAEISAVSSIEEDKIEGEDNELLEELKDNPNSWFNKSTWTVDDSGKFVRKDDGELFAISDGGDDFVTTSDSPVKAETELTEIEKKQKRIERLEQGAIKWKKNKDLRKVEINRMAFDQKILPLNDRIPIEHKRLLIELLTEPLRTLIVKYENYINNRITKLLAPAIPTPIKLAAIKWPWVFVQNPGFLYKTSSHFGEPKTFWVTPKLPYFFKQGTEQTILEERDAALSPYFLDCIDRAINRWYSARARLADREVYYASKMLNIKGNTYYHLLMLNPFWFEKLYKHVKSDELI